MIRILALLAALFALIPTQARAQASVTLWCYNGGTPNITVPCSTTYPVPISGTISASTTGFPTIQSTGTPISVTTGGVTGTLPTGTVVIASNVGTTNAAYCKLGASATTSDQYIAPSGGWFAFTVGANTQLTCITSTSTTTVNMVGGSGLPTGTGGGSGGGGGGAVTIASGGVASGAYASGAIASGAYASGAFAVGAGTDGWDVTIGAKADAKSTATDTTAITLMQVAKEISFQAQAIATSVAGPVPGQSNFTTNIGAVTVLGSVYNTIAASQTAQALTGGSGGATGDYLSHCVIYPVTTSPGVLTVFDSTSTTSNNVITFAGGSSSLSNLTPITIPVGAVSINGAWKVTTGANLLAICYGKFH